MKRKFTLYSLIVLSMVLFLMVGCATLFGPPPEGAVPWEQRLPVDKAYMFNSTYNSFAKDYKSQAAMPDLSEATKQLLKAKWTVMKEVYPLINTYSDIANTGGTPSQESEDKILAFLNHLGARLGKL